MVEMQLSSKIPLWFETSPFRGKRAADTTAKPMKSFSAIPPGEGANHKGMFEETIGQMNEDGISLVGAVHDYTDPVTGKGYLYFPIREV